MKPFARINLSSVLSSVALAKGDALRRGILVSSLALAAGCCTVDRTGEYYVATKTLTGQARCPDGLIPSVGALLAMIGAEYPFPFIVLAPPGAVIYGAEVAVFAPLWDTLCLPEDYFCYREEYVRKEQRRREFREAEELLKEKLDVALSDERFFTMDTPQCEALKFWLWHNAKDRLNAEQAACIAANMRKTPSLCKRLYGVVDASTLSDADFEWLYAQAIDLMRCEGELASRDIGARIAKSGRATDEQLAELKRLGVGSFYVEDEIKRRAQEKSEKDNQ